MCAVYEVLGKWAMHFGYTKIPLGNMLWHDKNRTRIETTYTTHIRKVLGKHNAITTSRSYHLHYSLYQFAEQFRAVDSYRQWTIQMTPYVYIYMYTICHIHLASPQRYWVHSIFGQILWINTCIFMSYISCFAQHTATQIPQYSLGDVNL